MDKKIYYTHKYKLNYLFIPKCGSTTIKAAFELKEFMSQLASDPLKYDYEIFAVVRNPVSRFMSAYNEIKKQYGFDSPDDLIAKIMVDGWFDHHIEPQIDFLLNCSVGEVWFMPITQLSGHIKDWTGKDQDKLNTSVRERPSKGLANKIREIYREDCMLHQEVLKKVRTKP